MDIVNKAIIAAMNEFEKEHGAGAKLEDGEEFATVFNDCVLIMGMEEGDLQVKFIAGKPYNIDMTVGFVEESKKSEMIRKAKLKTLHMFDNQDHNDRDYLLWKKIAEYMDGEIAIVIESASGDGKFVFLGLEDEKKNKELFYMMEQDSTMGAFIDDREEFDRTWDDGHYEPDNCFYLEPENVMFDCEKKQILKNDLISKSVLLEKLKKMQFDSTKETFVWGEIYQLIEETPITYNANEVELDLEEMFKHHKATEKVKRLVLEIVRRGGTWINEANRCRLF